MEFYFRMFWQRARLISDESMHVGKRESKANIKTKHTNIQKSYVFEHPMYIVSVNGSYTLLRSNLIDIVLILRPYIKWLSVKTSFPGISYVKVNGRLFKVNSFSSKTVWSSSKVIRAPHTPSTHDVNWTSSERLMYVQFTSCTQGVISF